MLNKEMTSSRELTQDQDPRSVTRATVFLLKKGIGEKVFSVSNKLGYFSHFGSVTQLFLPWFTRAMQSAKRKCKFAFICDSCLNIACV